MCTQGGWPPEDKRRWQPSANQAGRLQRISTFWHLDVRPVASRTVRRRVVVIQATQCEVLCYGSPRKWHVWVRCAQSCSLFATPWTIARQAPLSMGCFRQGYWSGLPFPSPGDLPAPGIEPTFLMSPVLAGGWILYHFSHLGSPSEANTSGEKGLVWSIG